VTDSVTRERHDRHLTYRVVYDLSRVRAFSDCVFAVAITLVVVTFTAPDRGLTDAGAATYLLDEWPRYLSYIAAFLVVGYTWMIHHQLFELIRRVDVSAIWLNLALLSFVVLTPYPMQLLGEYRTLSVPYILFNLDALLFGLLHFLLVAYATRHHRLVSARLPARAIDIVRLRALVFPVSMALATALAVPFGAWSVLAWLFIPLGRWLVRHQAGSLRAVATLDDESVDDETLARAERLEAEAHRVGEQRPLAALFAESGSLTRLVGFSDNVYAFSITLLVLQFTLPSSPAALDRELWNEVLEIIHPDLTGFFIGFAIVGLFWTIHHRDFLLIEHQDPGLRTLNLVHLMFIAVMPFATLVLSSYDRYISATVLYATCAGLASASLVVVFWYSTIHHRLVDPSIPGSALRERRIELLAAPGGFILSIPVAFVSPTAAQLMWILSFVGTRAFRLRRNRHDLGSEM
jgi:uncharacterized membrane protein